jgi:hypothetical protein
LNPASYPTITSTSTGYDIASTKNATSASLTNGDLKITQAATGSGFVEAQARFTSTPVTLTNAGDYVDLTYTFTNTGNVANGSASAFYVGMYNTGGSAPVSGLNNSGLTTTAGSSFATGGAQLWQGYIQILQGSGGTSKMLSRPQQNGAGTTSANQELLANNVGGGAFTNPTGTQLTGASQASTVALTTGAQYTEDYRITLNANGSEAVSSTLYSGVGTGGTVVNTQTANTPTTPVATSYDGLAMGGRFSGTSAVLTMDVTSLTVTTNISSAQPIISLTSAAPSGFNNKITNGTGADQGTFSPNSPVPDSLNPSSSPTTAALLNDIKSASDITNSTSNGPSVDYVAEAGLSPSDGHVYFLKLKLNTAGTVMDFDPANQNGPSTGTNYTTASNVGNYNDDLAKLIADINVGGGHAGTLTAARADSLDPGNTFYPGYDLAVSEAGGAGTNPEFLGFNMGNETAVAGFTVTDIAAVPEPATGMGMLLVGAGCLLRRRRRVARA